MMRASRWQSVSYARGWCVVRGAWCVVRVPEGIHRRDAEAAEQKDFGLRPPHLLRAQTRSETDLCSAASASLRLIFSGIGPTVRCRRALPPIARRHAFARPD